MSKVYHRILQIVGNVIAVEAEGVAYNELAEVSGKFGSSLAQVIRLQDKRVYLQVFAGSRGIGTGDEVRFLGHQMQVSGSDDLLGRIFNGRGAARDNRPPVTDSLIDIGGPSVNPAKRVIPRNMIRTGIPMIDVFNTLVESQKLPIFSVAGEPYNELLARIALQANSDIIVIGGMGLKYDEYLKFRSTLDESGALAKTVMFVHTAADPTVECVLVPDVSLAVAEKFALDGKDVLVLLTDMTSFADALKEIAITMEQIPSNRGYPGDLYSQLAARYEKAVDFEGAGSITILAVTTMPGDDVTHPVPDNTGYITEGQFYLKNGRIEPFGSLSRLKQQVNKGVDPDKPNQRSYLMSKVLDASSEKVTDKDLLRRANTTRYDHRTLMDAMIKLYAQYKEAVEKQSMGFKMSDWDKKLLKYGAEFEEKMMDLSVNIELIDALDLGWKILADNFDKGEVGIPSKFTDRFWPS